LLISKIRKLILLFPVTPFSVNAEAMSQRYEIKLQLSCSASVPFKAEFENVNIKMVYNILGQPITK